MRQKIHVYSIVAALTALTFLAVGCTMASTQDISITATDTTSQTMQTAPRSFPAEFPDRIQSSLAHTHFEGRAVS